MQKLSERVGAQAQWCGAAALAVACVIAGSPLASAQDVPHVAGVAPDRRAGWAPSITTPDRPADWHERAYAGIATPPPPLEFLKDQGGWYTPFTRPGMPGPYDIRGLHSHREPVGKSPANGAPASTRKP